MFARTMLTQTYSGFFVIYDDGLYFQFQKILCERTLYLIGNVHLLRFPEKSPNVFVASEALLEGDEYFLSDRVHLQA